MSTPMTMNAIAAARLIQTSGKIIPTTLPTTTPIAETAVKAKAEPMKTAQGRLDCAAIVIAASCVLSPISARKITPNVVRNDPPVHISPAFRSISRSLRARNLFHAPTLKDSTWSNSLLSRGKTIIHIVGSCIYITHWRFAHYHLTIPKSFRTLLLTYKWATPPTTSSAQRDSGSAGGWAPGEWV